jgi:hypothetical protein
MEEWSAGGRAGGENGSVSKCGDARLGPKSPVRAANEGCSHPKSTLLVLSFGTRASSRACKRGKELTSNRRRGCRERETPSHLSTPNSPSGIFVGKSTRLKLEKSRPRNAAHLRVKTLPVSLDPFLQPAGTRCDNTSKHGYTQRDRDQGQKSTVRWTRSGKGGKGFIEVRAALKTQRDERGLGMSAQSSLESSTTQPRLRT